VEHHVERAASTTGVTATPDRSRPGEPVSLTAEVTSTAGVPSGSVQFVVDGGAPADVTLVDGTASLPLPTLAAGEHDVAIMYSGDSQFVSSSATLAHIVDQGEAAVTVRADPSPTMFGAPVTFTVEASAAAPATTPPTGTATVDIDGTATDLTLDGNQRAQLTTTNLAVGAHTVTAAYSGDENYPGDRAGTTHDVTPAPTVIELASDANPAVSGQAVTFTATVTAPGSTTTPDGEVSFSIAGDEVTVSLSGGRATTMTGGLAVGDHDVAVAYAGTESFVAGDTVLARPQHVDKAETSIAATVSPVPAVSGQPLTITASVDAVAPGAGVPTGTVAVMVDGATAAEATLDDDGTTSIDGIILGAGSHDIDVDYTGDNSFNSSSHPLDQTIGARPVCGGLPATLIGTPGSDRLTGTPGRDVIVGLGGNDTIVGLGGNDTICAGAGPDTIRGGDGDDTARSRGGNDRVVGGAGNDKVRGGGGDDTVIGQSGDDVLGGGDGDDVLVGRRGADLLRGAAGSDRLDGGAGYDRGRGGSGIDIATACEFTRGLP
jgi:large repetitive protein